MALRSGTKLGPYEIHSSLGAGGMGEVYAGRDTRLGRDVAIKILPSAFAADPARLRRFEQEARATAALNHPNILAVYDIGNLDGTPYIVSELLEGQTLRERLRSGALSVRKSIETAVQVAQGLAAAHEKNIVHRDLKPENVFVTNDGRVKILDFGLAKLTLADSAVGQAAGPTVDAATDPGTVLGTMGYMSPEQLRGAPTDGRSDLFSLGAILYEMLSGRRAFHGATTADTISAILKEDPPDLIETNSKIPPALERIVRHCLEKNPAQRFQSARDVAFDLESLSAGTTGTTTAKQVRRPRALMAALLSAGLAALAVAFALGRMSKGRNAGSTVLEIHQLTFRRGTVWSAAFASDGRTVVYSAAWEGNPEELFTTSEQSPESRSLGIQDAELLAISSKGQMAIKLHPRHRINFDRPGTLATVPLSGGAPRALLDDVEAADWSADGSQMAVVQFRDGQFSLQYPIGTALFTSPLWVSDPRISPSGERVAFMNHPFSGDEGSVMVADKSGKVKELSSGWLTLQGLAWSPDGNEIWFTGTRAGVNRALYAVTLEGSERSLARAPGVLTLWDVSREGRVLIGEADERYPLMAKLPGVNGERDLTWFDASYPAGLSGDGKLLLFTEEGEAGGEHYGVYLRGTDGSPALRLGDGNACDISNDGKYAFSRLIGNPSKLYLLPTTGAPQELAIGSILPRCGLFLPGGHKILFLGQEPGHKLRVYMLDPEIRTPPTPVTPEGAVAGLLLGTNGKFVTVQDEGGQSKLYPLDGGAPQPIRGMEPGEGVYGMGSDGRTLFVSRRGALPQKVFRLDSITGRRELWKEIGPADRTGVDSLTRFLRVYQDGSAYTYGYPRRLSQLYLFKGLK